MIYINDISFIQRTVFSHPLVQHLGDHPVAKCSHIANSRKSPISSGLMLHFIMNLLRLSANPNMLHYPFKV